MYTLQLVKKYSGGAIRTKNQNGFYLNLPLCKYLRVNGEMVEVDKNFYEAKKAQALNHYREFKLREQQLSALRKQWHEVKDDPVARGNIESQARRIEAGWKN